MPVLCNTNILYCIPKKKNILYIKKKFMLNKIWDLSGILKWDHTTSNSFRLKKEYKKQHNKIRNNTKKWYYR